MANKRKHPAQSLQLCISDSSASHNDAVQMHSDWLALTDAHTTQVTHDRQADRQRDVQISELCARRPTVSINNTDTIVA